MEKGLIKERFQTLRTVLERQILAHFKKSVVVDLLVEGDCYVTQQQDKMRLGLMEDETKEDWETIRNIIRFKFHHELQHLLSTNPEQFQNAITDCKHVFESVGIKSYNAMNWAKILVNGLEDGRRFLVENERGFL